MAPNGAGRFFFRLIQTLPTFWATRILILRIFWGIFVGSQISGLGTASAWLGPPTWAQLGPKWVGPSWVQARNLGPKEIQKIKTLKIKIRVAQNVGKVWISSQKILLAPFGAIWDHFLRGPEKSENLNFFLIFAILPVWGPCCYPVQFDALVAPVPFVGPQPPYQPLCWSYRYYPENAGVTPQYQSWDDG